MPIIVLTKNEKKYNQLAFNWGVVPVFSSDWKTEREAFAIMSHFSIENSFISLGDFVVLISSFPFDKRGITNLMIVESIGDVLVKGVKGYGKKTKGNVSKIISVNGSTAELAKDKIIVIAKCDETYTELLKVCKGVVLQNNPSDSFSEQFAIQNAERFNVPIIIRAKHAFDILEEGESIILDPSKALIFLSENT